MKLIDFLSICDSQLNIFLIFNNTILIKSVNKIELINYYLCEIDCIDIHALNAKVYLKNIDFNNYKLKQVIKLINPIYYKDIKKIIKNNNIDATIEFLNNQIPAKEIRVYNKKIHIK